MIEDDIKDNIEEEKKDETETDENYKLKYDKLLEKYNELEKKYLELKTKLNK